MTGMMILVVASVFGCNAPAPDEREEYGTYKVEAETVMTLDKARRIAIDGDAETFTARVVYAGHESLVVVNVNDDLKIVLDSEMKRLDFLSRQFTLNAAMEAPILKLLLEDKERILETSTLNVGWVQYDGHAVDGAVLVDVAAASDDVSSEKVGVASQPLIYDYPNDAFYVPYYGTSTVYTSGTLQKIWLDSNSKLVISSYNSGLEIDTIIHGGQNNATCQTSGTSSNMPGWYADTEFLDDSGSTNCSIGTISAQQLQTNTLYWTWHPFGSFNSWANPLIDIQYQPKSWCLWVVNQAQCEANKPWCMCNMSYYPTEWLVSYNYNDAPGQEVSWIRN
jgi:hypothetical protein